MAVFADYGYDRKISYKYLGVDETSDFVGSFEKSDDFD